MDKEKEKELLLKGINLGIFLAFADTEADLRTRLDGMESLLSTAKQDKADEESLNNLKSQIEVYGKLLDNYTDYKCSSITECFSSLTIDECNFVRSNIKEVCIGNTEKVRDEFDFTITEVLLCKDDD